MLKKLLDWIKWLLLLSQKKTGYFSYTIAITKKEKKAMLRIEQITTRQKAIVNINPTNDAGDSRPIEAGSLKVTVLNGGATVNMLSDSSFELITPEVSDVETGGSLFDVTADADLGAGVTPLKDQIVMITSGDLATNLGLGVVQIVNK